MRMDIVQMVSLKEYVNSPQMRNYQLKLTFHISNCWMLNYETERGWWGFSGKRRMTVWKVSYELSQISWFSFSVYFSVFVSFTISSGEGHSALWCAVREQREDMVGLWYFIFATDLKFVATSGRVIFSSSVNFFHKTMRFLSKIAYTFEIYSYMW